MRYCILISAFTHLRFTAFTLRRSLMKLLMIYITTKNKDEARRIGKTLVSEKLAACVNIIDGMNSFYFWKSDLCDDAETVLIAKTRDSLLARLVRRVKELHSYEIPSIVALPIVGGNGDFLSWIKNETAPVRRARKTRRKPASSRKIKNI